MNTPLHGNLKVLWSLLTEYYLFEFYQETHYNVQIPAAVPMTLSKFLREIQCLVSVMGAAHRHSSQYRVLCTDECPQALLLLCGELLIIPLPAKLRSTPRPTAFRGPRQIIYQNVRLDRESCAFDFLSKIRVFRAVRREKQAKISHSK